MIYYNHSDISSLEQRFRTNFVNSLSGFRSLNLIGTADLTNNENLAIFNSVFHVGANPAMLGMVIRPNGPEHGTLKNIISTKSFTINNVLKQFYKNAHQTSARYESSISEFTKCNLNSKYIDGFCAPFVAESSIQIGLILQEIIPIKANETTIIIGTIQHVFLNDLILKEDGFLDPMTAETITNCGLDAYYQCDLIARLSYAKPDLEIKLK